MSQPANQRGIIAWFAGNSVASNLLLICIILLGIMSVDSLRKEAFPPRPVDSVTVTVPYDSGDAVLTEEGIAIKVEETLASTNGIKRITSVSDADMATITVEAMSGYDLDTLLRDVKSKVDAIYNFPADAEKPVIEKQQLNNHAYSIKIYGDNDRETLQTLAERIKVDLLAQSQVSNVEIKGKAEKLLSIEIDEAKLEAYGLTLSAVQDAVNAESASAISTSLRSEEQIVRLKVSEQAYYAQQFARIPVVTDTSGAIVRLGDISRIADTFDDRTFTLARYNGLNGIGIELSVNESGDIIKLVEQADQVIQKWQSSTSLPENVSIEAWNDGSELIRDRLALLIKNALTGIALVFIVLALFLNLRVAIWVVAGLPFIFCGTLFFMTEEFTGMSINEMTTFGFILALGIVVDDAVVVGESVYTTRRQEGDTLQSTIKGTQRVAVPTIFGVLTTVAVFVALANVEGGMGNVYAQFAVIVAICLMLSVVESKLILPSHLAHINTHRKIGTGWKDSWARVQHRCDSSLGWFTDKIYAPLVKQVIQFRYAALLAALAVFIGVMNMPFNGSVRVGFFPDIPGTVIAANLTMQNDASFGMTHKNLIALENIAYEADKQLSGEASQTGIGTVEIIASGDFTGSVTVELNDKATYSVNEFKRQWKELTGSLEGAKSLNIQSGFGGGNEFKVELKAWNTPSLEFAGEKFLQTLSMIKGVQGINDNFHSGQNQLKFNLSQQGYSLGLTTAELSRQVLQAFGGEVVQQYQRAKSEIKVRVRYPESERKDVSDILNAKIRLPNGSVVPLSTVATVTEDYQQNERTRIGGLQAYYVSAGVDKEIISPNELVQQLQETLVPELQQSYPDLDIHFAGEAEEQAETAGSMLELFIVAMMVIYILLAVPLRSYVQPLIIMAVIPFGLVGAILGHWFNDMMLSILSFNGIVALSGVVVNDSLLLVSRFNENIKAGTHYREAILEACTGRIRPVLLTSLTTFAGLAPLLSETSTQAQFIIPAAASLGYGILFATVITLIIIPAMLMIQNDVAELLFSRAKGPRAETNLEEAKC